MKIQLEHKFKDIISVENLLEAWREFARGKRGKQDIQEFSLRLMDNILALNRNLANHTYKHDGYQAFNICDPKPRNIHKAGVRDRLVHRAIYRKLYPFFNKIFIADSFSCRLDKGTHRAVNRFRAFSYIAGRNHTRTCWVLKCDIRKFFENIDHEILLEILERHILNRDTMWLLEKVIRSFSSSSGRGLPLGNLTSQLFVNVYMNEFDQFVKHKLRAKYYIRYADDFVLFLHDQKWLQEMLPEMRNFLWNKLRLEIHSGKVSIKTVASGIDWLGWVHFPDHRILRMSTKRRMSRRLKENQSPETLASYRGLLQHGNAQKLRKMIEYDIIIK